MTTLQNILAGAGADTAVTENFRSVSPAGLYGIRPDDTAGLVLAYYGGQFNGNTVADDDVTLTASAVNYVVANRSTGAVSVSTGTTNWLDTTNYMQLYQLTAGASSFTIASTSDKRQTYGGTGGGGGSVAADDVTYDNTGSGLAATDVQAAIDELASSISGLLSWNQQTASYTLDSSDANNGVAMNVAGANNLTVPPNASVPIPVGASVLVYQEGAGLTSIVAGIGVTIRKRSPLTLDSAGQYALITLVKRATDTWVLAGDVA